MPGRTTTMFATAALWLLLTGCTHAAASGASSAALKTMTLTLPRAAAADEAVHVRVTAGPLARGARIVVRLSGGEIAGSATRYGGRTDQKAGVFIIPLPPGAIRDGKIALTVEVEEKGKRRAPKAGEV